MQADRQPKRPRQKARVGQDQADDKQGVKPASTSIGSPNWSKECASETKPSSIAPTVVVWSGALRKWTMEKMAALRSDGGPPPEAAQQDAEKQAAEKRFFD